MMLSSLHNLLPQSLHISLRLATSPPTMALHIQCWESPLQPFFSLSDRWRSSLTTPTSWQLSSGPAVTDSFIRRSRCAGSFSPLTLPSPMFLRRRTRRIVPLARLSRCGAPSIYRGGPAASVSLPSFCRVGPPTRPVSLGLFSPPLSMAFMCSFFSYLSFP